MFATLCEESPVPAHRAIAFLKEHLGLKLNEADLALLLALACEQKLTALQRHFGLRQEVQDHESCWLLRNGDTAGVLLKVRNHPQGFRIGRLTSLGGGEHCTGLEA